MRIPHTHCIILCTWLRLSVSAHTTHRHTLHTTRIPTHTPRPHTACTQTSRPDPPRHTHTDYVVLYLAVTLCLCPHTTCMPPHTDASPRPTHHTHTPLTLHHPHTLPTHTHGPTHWPHTPHPAHPHHTPTPTQTHTVPYTTHKHHLRVPQTCHTPTPHPTHRHLPGSSPGGSREFKAETVSARIRKQLLN